MTNIDNNSAQAKPKQRIVALDIIRGMAVCAIVVMNIINFSMSFGAYVSPIAGAETGVNYVLFCLQHVFIDQKAMAVFSMLFGAGAVMFIENQMRKSGNYRRYYWRMFWLLMIGLAHMSINPDGDILSVYAVVGFCCHFFGACRCRA